MLGSVNRVVVGAASEGVDRLPRFTAQPQPAPRDDFPQNHPAGRAARLRPRRSAQAAAGPAAAGVPTGVPVMEPHPGAPLEAPPQHDPSAVTAELAAVPDQRGDGRRRPVGGRGEGGEPPAKGGGRRGLLVAGTALAVVAAAGVGGYVWSQGKYYIGVSSDGRQVEVYQGVSQVSFLASDVSYGAPLAVQSIPVSLRDAVKGDKSYDSKDEALTALRVYQQAAQSCSDFRKEQAQGGQVTSPAAPTTTPTTTTVKPGVAIPTLPQVGATSQIGGGAPPAGVTSPGFAGAPSTTDSLNGGALEPTSSAGQTASSGPAQGEATQMAQYCAGTSTDGSS
jgi:hypothetical protein